MRRVVPALLIVFVLWSFPIFSQYEKPADQTSGKPEDIVREWFKRLNEVSPAEDTVKRFMDLYQPDALQQLGPSEKQMGPVFYQDRRQIQKWVQDFSKTHLQIPETAYFSIRVQTKNEKTAELIYTTTTPWGDIGASAEFTARYIDRDSKKAYMITGAAFFQFTGGRISKLRLYMPREERMEIVPPYKT